MTKYRWSWWANYKASGARVLSNCSLNRTPLGGASAPSFESPVSLVR
jgi:hypothetical protein